MTITYTSLLGLTKPDTGTQSGTWGSDLNTGLTDYLDAAVAGAQVISGSQTAVTLSVTTGTSGAPSALSQAGSGATGSSQYQIIRCTGNPAGLLTITAPASDKTYVILNATSTSQSVKIVGAGPTTGVTIVSGERAFVAWNGSDFVKVGGAAGGSNTQVQYNNAGVFGGITNATTDGTTLSMTSPKVITGINDTNGAELLKVTATASAVNELTLANAAAGNAPTLSATGDDTNIGITLTPKGTGTLFTAGNVSFDGGTFVFNESGADKDFRIEGDTDANLFFTDASTDRVGIGTSSPGAQLQLNKSGTGDYTTFRLSNSGASGKTYEIGVGGNAAAAGYANNLYFYDSTAASLRMTLDSSGNLGLGVTPSAWASTYRAYQVGQAGSLFGLTNDQDRVGVSSNAYFDTTDSRWEYIGTGYAMRYDQNAGEHQWYTAASGAANGAITFTQAMTLDASGNLGIGVTSPSAKLHVQAATNQLRLQGTANTNKNVSIFYTESGDYGQINCDESGVDQKNLWITGLNLLFGRNTSTERARITSGGDFFIGNGETAASPSAGILSATGGTGTNIAGANLTIRGGASTGTGAGGVIIFSTAAAGGTSGTATNSATERARITSGGQFFLGSTSTPNSGSVKMSVVGGSSGGAASALQITYNGGTFGGGLIGALEQGGGLQFYTFTNNVGSESYTERARITSGGNLLVGTTTDGQKLTVEGNQRFTGSQVGTKIENQQTGVSVSTATTILDDAGGRGRLVVVNGISSGDRFCDLVLCSTGVSPTVVASFTALGSPTARTYTRSGSVLQLAMASGTYTVTALALGY